MASPAGRTPLDEIPADPGRLVASCDRIKAELGWSPEYPDIDTIILHAYRWRQAHPNGYN